MYTWTKIKPLTPLKIWTDFACGIIRMLSGERGLILIRQGDITWLLMTFVLNMKRQWITDLSLFPRICPTIRLDIPIPIICMEVVRPMAVPTVAWETTSGIEGHKLAWNEKKSGKQRLLNHTAYLSSSSKQWTSLGLSKTLITVIQQLGSEFFSPLKHF